MQHAPEAVVALKELEVMAHTDQERILYEARQRAIFAERTRHNYFMRQKDEGLQEGLEQGLRQGLDSMRRKGNLANEIIVKRLELGLPKLSFDQLVDFSDDELRRMLSDLDVE